MIDNSAINAFVAKVNEACCKGCPECKPDLLAPSIARSERYNSARISFEDTGDEEALLEVCDELDKEAGRKRLEICGFLKAAFRAVSGARAEKLERKAEKAGGVISD